MDEELRELLETMQRETHADELFVQARADLADLRRHIDVRFEAQGAHFDRLAEATGLLDEKVDRRTEALDEKIDRGSAETQALIRYAFGVLEKR